MERLLGSSVFRWWRLLSVTLLVLPHSSSYSIPSLEVLNSEGIGGAKAPVHLGEINHQCWDAASLSVIEARKLRVADSVGELWDFMTQLSGSTQGLHRSMFMELAQVFWKKYVDCVMARAHGLGRRARASRQEIIKVMTYRLEGIDI